MRIAQVNVYFNPFMVGGAEWYVYNISRQLVRLGHEVDVFTADRCGGVKLNNHVEEVDGIRVRRLPLRLDLSYRLKVWDGLEEALVKGGYDIIHTYDYAQPHTLTATKVGEAMGIPVVLTVFDLHSLIPRTFAKQFFIGCFDRLIARYILRSAERVLVRAPNLLPHLLSLGLSADRVQVTPSGVLDEALHPFEGELFLRKHGIPPGHIILYVGRLHPMKGPQHLLMAAPSITDRYPDARFVFVGPDQNGFQRRLVELSLRLGVSERSIFTGPIRDFHEKMSAYASCDVFVLPSGYEGTSQAIFEAMAQGRPIIATARGGIPSQIEDSKDGVLVEYGDVDALAEKLLLLLEDRELASRLGVHAREKVKGYTYSCLTRQLESIYGDILESSNGRSDARRTL